MLPFAPDNTADNIARAVAAALSDGWGKTVFVDTLPGRDGHVALAEVASSTDLHTLLLGHCGSLAFAPLRFDGLAYDPLVDLKPISLLAKVPSLYVVPAASPLKSLQQLVALARASPAHWTYGSLGGGSPEQLAIEYLAMVSGMHLAHLPCDDTKALLAELLSGRLAIAALAASTVMAHIAGRRLRCIACGGPQRLAELPDVPTVAEQGWPGYESTQWYGLLAPAALSDDTVDRLSMVAARAVRRPDAQALFRREAAIAIGSTAIEFARFITEEQRRWKPVVARLRNASLARTVH